MGEELGQITLLVSVLVYAIAEVLIAGTANMLAVHVHVLTRHIHIAFVTEEIAVFVCAVADLFITYVAIMVVYLIVSAVDDPVAIIAAVVLVSVGVSTDELSLTFITVSVIIIIVAPGEYAAIVADVIPVIIRVRGIVGVHFTLGFHTADVAVRVFILVDMIVTDQFCFTVIALPIIIGIHAYIRHPYSALIADMIDSVYVDMILSVLVVTEGGA